MKIIGITGGIGSGKTTVCKIFETLHVPVYYADIRAKHLMTYDITLKQNIKLIFGPEAYHKNGRLNRTYVSAQIFSDPVLLKKINELVHPAVHTDVRTWKDALVASNALYGLQEAALLVENGSYKNLDGLIVVTCPEDIRIDRVVKRDKTSRESILKKIQNQLDEKEKIKVADFIIVNDGNNSIIEQVFKIHRTIIKRYE